MQPSEKYAVDYTDSFGFKWSKPMQEIYPGLGTIDDSIGLSSYNNDIVKKIYRKLDKYIPLYDDSITFTSDTEASVVWKYYKRSNFPTETVKINTVVISGLQDGDKWAIGTSEEASSPLGGLNSRFLVDAEYNKILFKVNVRRFKNFSPGTEIINSYAWDYNSGSNFEDVALKDIIDDGLYPIFYHSAAKAWNGSAWTDISAEPALLCKGDTVQSIQGAGSSFNNTYTFYNLRQGTGSNIELTANVSNNFWTGNNFCSNMIYNRYALSGFDNVEFKPDFAADPDGIKAAVKTWIETNGTLNVSYWLSIERKVIDINSDMKAYIEFVGYFYIDNSHDLHCVYLTCNATPALTGKAIKAFIAGFGLYYLADNSADLTGITPDNLGDSDDIWLGEMAGDGTTTGRWIKGSDIDSYSGYNKDGNVVNPDYDPSGGGGGGGGYADDPWKGVNFSGVGVGGAGAFAKVYYMTSTELANLRSWMGSINVPEGFDPMQQIIGLSQVPVALSGSSTENVVFINSSAVYDPGVTTRAVDTGISTQQSMGTPIRYSLGSVNIKRRMQERGEPYLDYDCQIELYLPLIGMFSLDTQAVMGRTIYADAVLDPISGTLAAYAYVTKDGENLPIAYGSTTIGVDLPISAQQYSVARAALKQANAQLGTSILSSTLSLIAAATAGGSAGAGAKTSMGSNGLAAAGIREAGADYMKASQAGNIFGDFMQWGRTVRQLNYGNNTAIAGSFGGSTAQWSYPFTPYVKIIRPRYEKPDNYKHSQGVPYVHTLKVGQCTGFIQCIGVDVSGITRATDLERQAIQAALTNGVFAGGGS